MQALDKELIFVLRVSVMAVYGNGTVIDDYTPAHPLADDESDPF